MPQMSPYNWFMMLIMLNLIYTLITSFIHFNIHQNYTPPLTNSYFYKFTMKW